MHNTSAKELLEKHKSIESLVDVLLDEASQLRNIVRKTGINDQKAVQKLDDFEAQLGAEIGDLVDLKIKIRDAAKLLGDDIERVVIERRFILGQSVPQIAGELGYCTRHVSRILRGAMDKLDQILDDI